MSRCPVCGAQRRLALEAIVLEHHPASFLKCDACGFLGIDEPRWLEEAYESVIAQVDTGVLSRARDLEPRLSALILLAFGSGTVNVDFGGGYGALVRTMRDAGIDFRWSDPYCENLLARGFEHRGEPATVVTLIEVLEHALDPLALVRDTLERTDAQALVITTELLPEPVPDVRDWWYYSLATGQHISFFERRTLAFIASDLKLSLHSRNNLHVLHRGAVERWHFLIAATRLARPVAALVGRRLKGLPDNPLLLSQPPATDETPKGTPENP